MQLDCNREVTASDLARSSLTVAPMLHHSDCGSQHTIEQFQRPRRHVIDEPIGPMAGRRCPGELFLVADDLISEP
jgi:hypothetical protein